MAVSLVIGLVGLGSMAMRIPQSDCDDLWRDFTEACRRSGVTQDQVARIQGITPPQLAQQLRGVGHLSLQRLASMRKDPDGQRFLWAYLPILAKSWGFPEAEVAFRLCELAKSIDLKEVLRDSIGRVIDVFQTKLARAQLHERERDDHNREGVA